MFAHLFTFAHIMLRNEGTSDFALWEKVGNLPLLDGTLVLLIIFWCPGRIVLSALHVVLSFSLQPRMFLVCDCV